LEPTSSEQKIPQTYEQKVLKKYIKNFRKWSKKFLQKKVKSCQLQVTVRTERCCHAET
jgi:hypothetical protein